MAKLERVYAVEKKDGDLSWNKPSLLHKFPVKDGKLMIGGKFYAVDPARFRRRTFKIWFGMRRVYQQISFYKEGNPEPLPYFASDGLDPIISSKIVTTLLNEKTVDDLQMRQHPGWLLAIAMFAAFVAGAVIMYVGFRGGV
jgi:hypothetical protein